MQLLSKSFCITSPVPRTFFSFPLSVQDTSSWMQQHTARSFFTFLERRIPVTITL